MKKLGRTYRRFVVHSDRGHVAEPIAEFSSALERDGMMVTDNEVIASALRILAKRVAKSSVLSNPRAVREYLAVRFAGLEHEIFACLYVNSRNRLLACEEIFRGTLDGASIHSREVVKQALAHNAAAVILAHNHPSGVAEPSQADELITRRLKEALALVDIRVLDHLVIGADTVESFAERKLL